MLRDNCRNDFQNMNKIISPKIIEKKKDFSAKLKDLIYDIEVRLFCKISYWRALSGNKFKPKVALFYPEKPQKWHALYTVFPILGYKIASDTNAKADIVVAFADATFRKDDETLASLREKHKVVNIDCVDISKEKVERVFKEVFGYESNINPKTYSGRYIRKSNLNGKHDGRVFESHSEPEDGYIYQKVVNNKESDGFVLDIRVFIVNGAIPFIVKRYRAVNDRFNNIKKAVLVNTEEIFNQDEINKILLFCKKFGMDYGELDVLRDRDDSRIYIVDANNTPSSYCQWAVVSRREYYNVYLKKLAKAFESGFLEKKNGAIIKIKDLFFDIEVIIYSKFSYLRALSKNGFKPKIALCYPEKPKTYHILYTILHKLGYKITSDINIKPDIAISFADATTRKEEPRLADLNKTRKVINADCADISKEKVERVFKETFGYGTFVDPRIYKGKCVSKSSANGKHDGKVIDCPSEPEEGRIYQKLINNQYGDTVTDYRIVIMNDAIPYIFKRYRSAYDRFDHTKRSAPADINDCLSREEINKIFIFGRKFGLDSGELDIVRDKDDKKIYIVDVNNTPAAPRMGKQMTRREYYNDFLKKMTQGFSAEFLNVK